MESLLAALLVVVIYIGLPALVGLAIAGSYLWWRRRVSRKAGITELVCSIDADCPPGYVCVGRRCVLATEAQSA